MGVLVEWCGVVIVWIKGLYGKGWYLIGFRWQDCGLEGAGGRGEYLKDVLWVRYLKWWRWWRWWGVWVRWKFCRLFVELSSFVYGHFRGGPMEKYRVSALLFEVQKLSYLGALKYELFLSRWQCQTYAYKILAEHILLTFQVLFWSQPDICCKWSSSSCILLKKERVQATIGGNRCAEEDEQYLFRSIFLLLIKFQGAAAAVIVASYRNTFCEGRTHSPNRARVRISVICVLFEWDSESFRALWGIGHACFKSLSLVWQKLIDPSIACGEIIRRDELILSRLDGWFRRESFPLGFGC